MTSAQQHQQNAQRKSWRSSLSYWVPTTLIAGLWLSGAVGSLLKSEASMEVFHRLHYPDYFATILGCAQILGVIALLAPVPVTVREWAYAGLAFDACAASASLLAMREPISQLTFPLIGLALVLGSHRAWRHRIDWTGSQSHMLSGSD